MSDLKPRKAKKSETLEVRLPFETKRDFLDACRDDGTTASEVVRTSIDGYLAARVTAETPTPHRNVIAMIPKPLKNPRVLAGAAGAISLAVFAALPSAAGPDLRSAFERLDANKDGVLTDDEFLGGGDVSADETKVIVIKRNDKTVEGAEAKAEMEKMLAEHLKDGKGVKEHAFTFFLDDEADGAEGGEKEFKFVQRHEVIVRKDGEGGEPGGPVVMDFRKREFGNFDTDGDGKVSYAEYEARQTTMLTNGFNMLDENKDGSLSRAEYEKIGSPMVLQIGSGDEPKLPDDVLETIRKSVPGTDETRAAARFEKLDRNADGKLSLQEYLP